MIFAYVLGSGSKWGNNEIRYSIRSVLKFHPNAEIHIIGERPHWYQGENHHYVPDAHECPYVNQWKKLEHACTLFDEFVYMDDDFFLLQPLEPAHYRQGTLKEYAGNKKPTTVWNAVLEATYQAMPEADRHCLHAPLPIISKNFLTIAENFPQRHEAPSLVPRQIYCHYETEFEVRDKKDLKFTVTPVKIIREQIIGEPFFSIENNIKSRIFRNWIEKLYPIPSPFEAGEQIIIKN